MKRKVFILSLGLLFIHLSSYAFKIKKKVNINTIHPNTVSFYNIKGVIPTFFNFGLNAGVSCLSFKKSGFNSYQFSCPGLNIGAYLNIKSSEHFSYRHELMLAYGVLQKSNQKDIYSLRINIPWQANYHFSERNMLFVGVVPTILLSENSSKNINTEDSDKKSSVDPIHMGACMGVELGVSKQLGFGFRFFHYLKQSDNEKIEGFNGLFQMYLNYSLVNTLRYDKKLMSVRFEK